MLREKIRQFEHLFPFKMFNNENLNIPFRCIHCAKQSFI